MTQIKVFGEADKRALEQLERCGKDKAEYAVLCADHHVGYSQPIGGAIAYEHYVSPSGVGYDIGCGNKAVRTNLDAGDLDMSKIMDELVERISFGVGRTNKKVIDHPVLDKIHRSEFEPLRKLYQLAKTQLGTVGSGNHYVDIFKDENNKVWVGVHFGSRGFGHKTATGFLSLAQEKDFDERTIEGEMDAPPILLDTRTQLGQDYIYAMQLAGEYAYAGRDVVVDEVLNLLGTKSVEEIHNHHNFAWLENHFGKNYWVVRKGCTPAFPSQKGFVGATMGDVSVILTGVDSENSKSGLYSTVHGAGRIISRRKAAGSMRWKKLDDGRRVRVIVEPGIVDFFKVKNTLETKGIVLRGGGADEAPEVYKKLDEVLDYHAGTIKILHRLTPMGVAMGGDDVFDPYKD